MINKITISNVLPEVFAGMEREDPVASSQVWLRDVEFKRETAYLIEAESGTGKTSLCSFIYGLRTDYSGNILFDGADSRAFSIDRWCEIRRTELAFLPQEMHLFAELTVAENIDIKNNLTHHKSKSWIQQTLERLEIADKLNQPAGKLSVGQQQRVAIVRALCQPFSFLLIDEPVSHLDARNNAIVASIVAEEALSAGASVIATSVGNKLSLEFNTTLLL